MKKAVYSVLMIAAICGITSCKSSKQAAAPVAQQPGSGIMLQKGDKIRMISETVSDTDMGMGMQMKQDMNSTSILEVINVDDSSYTFGMTPTRMKMKMSMMGQDTEYDSEKGGDSDSEITKGMADKINKTDTVRVNKITGKTIFSKTENDKAGENPLMGMMSAMGLGAENVNVVDAFFYTLPAGKKVGDSWTDSTMVKSMKTIKHYTLKSIDNGIATLDLKSTINGTGDTEMQGTSVSFTMNTTGNSTMLVDTKTNRVKKNSTTADLGMTMDVMGQSMPITSKSTTTVMYE